MFGALNKKVKDQYEEQERIEEKKKYNFYNRRSKLAIPEVISMAQFRLSLFSIFNTTDDQEIAGLKTKGIKNQLEVVKESTDTKFQEANEEIS